jgi:hypothetical protein
MQKLINAILHLSRIAADWPSAATKRDAFPSRLPGDRKSREGHGRVTQTTQRSSAHADASATVSWGQGAGCFAGLLLRRQHHDRNEQRLSLGIYLLRNVYKNGRVRCNSSFSSVLRTCHTQKMRKSGAICEYGGTISARGGAQILCMVRPSICRFHPTSGACSPAQF